MATKKRLIDANAFLAELKEHHDYIMQDPEIGKQMKWRESVCFGTTVNVLVKQPTMDAVEVVHGRWVDANGIRKSKCENCGVEFGRVMGDDCYYCPNCGAKMDGDGNG